MHSYFFGSPTTYEKKGEQFVSFLVNGGGWPGLVTTDPEIRKEKSSPNAGLGVEGLHGKEMRKQFSDVTTGKLYVYWINGKTK